MRRSPGFDVEHRPGYQQLLTAALAPLRAFDAIVVEDLSRLTRYMGELMRLTARLRLNGIELVGVSDGIATGRQGSKVQLAVKGLMNELYLDDLRAEWIRQVRPDLRIIPDTLWMAVQAHRALAREAAGPHGRRPHGAYRVVYSPYLLSGLIRCGSCGARMIAQRTTRRKRGRIYPYGYHRCSFAAHKGPAVCLHGAWYRQIPLESLLVEQFRAATSPPMLDALTLAVAQRVEARVRARDARADAVKDEILRLEQEAGNLVRFLRGGESPTVREELAAIESALQGLRIELATLQAVERPAVPSVSRAGIQARVDHLATLIATDPVRARPEIRKHFDGDLELVPLQSGDTGRRVELRGRLKPASLLTPTDQDQEAGSPTIGCGGALATAYKPVLDFRWEITL